MSADALEVRTRMVGQHLDRLRENAAVVISALSVLIAAGALMFAGVALYAALDAKEDIRQLDDEIRLYELYTDDLIAEMKAFGITIPIR